ncbi:GyrI-like domain-containing protein [Methylobacterium tarhaniae]|uniref:GyrI-like domain-containing protein n=1 Tax=Methylobacterium tarhaniae TaxID=1187852 RepID=UPI003D0325B6
MSDRMQNGIGAPEIVLVSPSICAVEWGEVTFAAIPQFQREARARVDAALAAQDMEKTGPEVTFSLSPSGDRIRIAAGSTITGNFRATDSVTVQEIPGGRAVHLRLEGPYALLPKAWRTLVAWVVEHGHEPAGLSWEAYGDPSVPVTNLYTLLTAR